MSILSRFCDLYDNLSLMNCDNLNNIYHDEIVFEDPLATHRGIKAVKLYFAKLLQNTTSCKFVIHQILNCNEPAQASVPNIDHVVIWTMHLKTNSLNKGDTVTLQGTSLLSIKSDKIIYHRDYYDLGEMVYEHIPLVGSIIKTIKRKLANP